MAERVDMLQASHEALKTELAETERQIQGCYQRAEKLKTALEALQQLLSDGPVTGLSQPEVEAGAKTAGSVTKVMDKLQEDGAGKDKTAQNEEAVTEPTPVWLEKKEA
jgi:hypothetical protein